MVTLQRGDSVALQRVQHPALPPWTPSSLPCQGPWQEGSPAIPGPFLWAPSWSPHNFLNSEKKTQNHFLPTQQWPNGGHFTFSGTEGSMKTTKLHALRERVGGALHALPKDLISSFLLPCPCCKLPNLSALRLLICKMGPLAPLP